MPPKLLALDLDGTALTSRKCITPQTREAVSSLIAAGTTVLLITGRHHKAAKPYHLDLALSTPIICSNGAYVWNYEDAKASFESRFDQVFYRELISSARSSNIDVVVANTEFIYYDRETSDISEMKDWYRRLFPRDCGLFARIDNLHAVVSPHKIVVRHNSASYLTEWLALTANNTNCESFLSDLLSADIIPKGCSKGKALSRYCQSQNIDMASVVAVGDQMNDVSMFQAAGTGIAMGNAPDKVKGYAKWITTSNDEDGVINAIRYCCGVLKSPILE